MSSAFKTRLRSRAGSMSMLSQSGNSDSTQGTTSLTTNTWSHTGKKKRKLPGEYWQKKKRNKKREIATDVNVRLDANAQHE